MPVCDPMSSPAPRSERLRTTQQADVSPNLIKAVSRMGRRVALRASKLITVIGAHYSLTKLKSMRSMLRLIIKILVIVLKSAAADSDFWITNRFLSPNALNASLIYRSQRLDPRGFPTHTAILVDLRNCPPVHAGGFLFG
jgi:hypothetical protein